MNVRVNTWKEAEQTYTDLQITPLTFPKDSLGDGRKIKALSNIKWDFSDFLYLSTRINIEKVKNLAQSHKVAPGSCYKQATM